MIMPLPRSAVDDENQAMTTAQMLPISALEEAGAVALVGGGPNGDHYRVRSISPIMRLLSRAFAGSLDRRLAGGSKPEDSSLLATRAQTLVALDTRREVAAAWLDLAEFAYRPAVARTRAPLCRDRIVAAECEIQALATALAAPTAPAAQGVARALVLLTDGTRPIYNRHARDDLRSRLRAATEAANSLV
jgi:hypothetical protein